MCIKSLWDIARREAQSQRGVDYFDADLKALAIIGEPNIGDNEDRFYRLVPFIKQMADRIANLENRDAATREREVKLKKATLLIANLADCVRHLQVCAACAQGDLSDCDGGKECLAMLQDAEAWKLAALATPETLSQPPQ